MEQFAPLMPKPGRRGRPREVDFREVINAVRYLVRSGCGGRMTIHDVALMLDRERAGCEASPSAVVIGSQSVKAPSRNEGLVTQIETPLLS